MLIAIPVWQGRVSPVFDVAGQVLLVELDRSIETARRLELLTDEAIDRRAERIAFWGVTTLICGAISRPLESLLVWSSEKEVERVCGDAEDVLNALGSGDLEGPKFAMPGCCNQRRRRQRGCGSPRRKNES